jgi:phosphoesterase RecJ-like protein
MNNFQKSDFLDTIQANDNFLIISHVNPDGDTIGSALAIAHFLKRLNKKFVIINEHVIANKYLFLPLADQFITPDKISNRFDSIIAVDCADIKRIGEQVSNKIADTIKVFVNIDHHPTNDFYGTLNIIDSNAASTTLVIYNLFEQCDFELDYQIAVNLYTGLMTDTGSFKYGNTTAESHLVAAKLIDYGINVYDIADRILETNSINQLITIRESLATLEVHKTGKIAWITVVLDSNNENDKSSVEADVEGLVNYPRSIEGVEVAISFKLTNDNKIKVGLRSKKYVDVSKIAAAFDGGGHKRAAGCTIAAPLNIVKEKIIDEITKHI